MKARWLVPVIFLIPAGGAGYMTWLSGQAGDDGQWFFGVMAVFFLLLAVTPFVPARKKQPAAEPPAQSSTRFVPHWFMLLAVLVLIGTVILAIVVAILRRL